MDQPRSTVDEGARHGLEDGARAYSAKTVPGQSSAGGSSEALLALGEQVLGRVALLGGEQTEDFRSEASWREDAAGRREVGPYFEATPGDASRYSFLRLVAAWRRERGRSRAGVTWERQP